jgi:hypothetical protein
MPAKKQKFRWLRVACLCVLGVLVCGLRGQAQTPAQLLTRGPWLLVAIAQKNDSLERPLRFDQLPDSLRPGLRFRPDSLYISTLDAIRGVYTPSRGWWWAEPSGFVLYTEKDFSPENQALTEIVLLTPDRMELLPAQSPVRMIYRCVAPPLSTLPPAWQQTRYGTRNP